MASVLHTVLFDHAAFRHELAEFGSLLASKADLSETDDILPFFRSHQNLTAYIGALYLNLPVATEVCFEFDLQSAFRADVLLGSRKEGKFCIVEFEPGKVGAIFKNTPKKYPEWSARFEHAFSQLVDWFCSLADQRKSDDYMATFGAGQITFVGLLVMGRSTDLDESKQRRLTWRSDRVTIDTHRVTCITFDQLYLALKEKYDFLAAAADSEVTTTVPGVPPPG